MMKRLLSFCIAIAVAHFGLKFYLYQTITGELDNMIKEVSLFIQIDYDGVSTSLMDKSIAIHGMEILPNGSAEPIKIRKISMKGANFFAPPNQWFDALDFEKPIQQSVSVHGLEINLNEYLKYGNLNQMKDSASANIENLKDLGYETLLTDLTINLKTYPELKTLELEYKQSHEGMFLFGFEATVAAQDYVPSHFNPQQAYQNLQVVDASLHFKDDSFMERLFQYRANAQGKTIEEVKQELIAQLNDSLKTNELELPQAHHQALLNVISDYKPITFSIKPMNPMGLQTFSHLHLYKANDVTKMLNLEIANK